MRSMKNYSNFTCGARALVASKATASEMHIYFKYHLKFWKWS